MGIQQPQVAARYGALLKELADDGRIDVALTADRLGVTQETIRRDLRALETEGKLRRVYGGAVPLDVIRPSPMHVPDLSAGSALSRCARWVWDQLPRTGAIALGAGPTAMAIAQVAAADPPSPPGLTVITTSLDAAAILSRGQGTLVVYLIGGTVSRQTGGQEGQWAIDDLARFQVAAGVVCPVGVDAARGLTASSVAAAAVDGAIVRASQRIIVFTGAEACGHAALVQFSTIEPVDQIAVYGNAQPGAVQSLRNSGTDLEVFV